MKKLENYVNKFCPRQGLQSLTILHDNAAAHTSKETVTFLEKKDLTILPHPPYSPDLAQCDLFLFLRLKKSLEGWKFHSRQALEAAVFQFHKDVPKKDYMEAFHKWIKRLELCIHSKGEYFEGMH